jgi:hypothetical protein
MDDGGRMSVLHQAFPIFMMAAHLVVTVLIFGEGTHLIL